MEQKEKRSVMNGPQHIRDLMPDFIKNWVKEIEVHQVQKHRKIFENVEKEKINAS